MKSSYSGPYNFLSAEQLLRLEPMHWIVRSILPSNGLSCIYGASGSGKSFLALDLCASVADGGSWFGHEVSPVPVVYLTLEGEHGFQKRVYAWQNRRGRSFPKNVSFVREPFNLLESPGVEAMIGAVLEHSGPGSLLVIDTLNRASSGADENSVVDMGLLLSALQKLRMKISGSILLIHHSGKVRSKGLRGHSSLFAALDSAIEVFTLKGKVRCFAVAKSKDDCDGSLFPFELKPLIVGHDQNQKPITSCIVEQLDASVAKGATGPNLSGKNMIAAHKALGSLLSEDSSLPFDEAILIVAEKLTCREDQRKYRAKRVVQQLIEKGAFHQEGQNLFHSSCSNIHKSQLCAKTNSHAQNNHTPPIKG